MFEAFPLSYLKKKETTYCFHTITDHKQHAELVPIVRFCTPISQSTWYCFVGQIVVSAPQGTVISSFLSLCAYTDCVLCSGTLGHHRMLRINIFTFSLFKWLKP